MVASTIMSTKEINTILARHPVLGVLASEAEMSFQDERYMSSLSNIFILTEGMLKYSLDIEDDARFVDLINNAAASDVITEGEKTLLHQVRKVRNSYFHGNPFSEALDIDGVIYLLSESETQKLIYEMFSGTVLNIAERIVTANDIQS